MADECSDNQTQGGEYNQHAIKAHAFNLFGYGCCDGVQKARGRDRFAKGETAGSKNDDSPEEIIKVLFSKDAGAKEQNYRDYSDNAHVTEYMLKLMRYTPQNDGHYRDYADEPLNSSELVLHRSYWYDSSSSAGPKRNEE